jgi:hypothetical protein
MGNACFVKCLMGEESVLLTALILRPVGGVTYWHLTLIVRIILEVVWAAGRTALRNLQEIPGETLGKIGQ